MKAWLITINPDKWTWPDFDNVVKNTKDGVSKYKVDWTCSNTHVQIGDRVFLMRQGNYKKGIMAAGHATKASFLAPHFDPSKAATGQTVPHIEVEFDYILDPSYDDLIDLNKLKSELPNQTWSPQSSGIEIVEPVYPELEYMWTMHIGISKNIYNLLKAQKDINPDSHDGSYELIRTVIQKYSEMNSDAGLDSLDYNDLNLVYLATIGTWADGLDKKKEHVKSSNLPQTAKNDLLLILDNLWENAKNSTYSNSKPDNPSLGMFGSGFFSFKSKVAIDTPKKILDLLVIMFSLNSDEEIIAKSLELGNLDLSGLGLASISEILHCLWPNVFPISNNRVNHIFDLLGFSLNNSGSISAYLENVSKIKSFRDFNFEFKNYRVLDIVAQRLKTTDIDYISVLEYLENNRSIPFEKITAGMAQTRIDELNSIKDKGRKAVAEMKKMAKLCADKFGLDHCSGNKWLDGSNTKTRNYLWTILKYSAYENKPETISLFVDVDDKNVVRYRFSLEIQNDKATAADFNNHHKFLDYSVPQDSNLVYVTGSDHSDNIATSTKNAQELKEQLADGTISKVQICRIVNKRAGLTSEECEQEMLEAVKNLLPFYEIAIGKESSKPIQNETIEIKRDVIMDTTNNRLELNTILYGPPGTGKTYNTKRYAVAICDFGGDVETCKSAMPNYKDVESRYEQLEEDNRIAFTTFHQSYGYEDFIEGIKPVSKIDTTGNHYVDYPIQPGSFKVFCNEATRFEMNNKNCVFIIDEINRGNISKIFGELITLIESTKRINADESTFLQLPYSKESFGVPKNVYILGTMNTADRSIALMDTALRRRFNFIEMMPETSVLNELGANKVVFNGKELDVVKMLNTINDRIEVLYDRSHTIGHAFFTSLAKDSSLTNLRLIFENKVIPLLQEYFYDDYEKILLVLGDNAKTDNRFKFIIDETNRASSIFKGSVDENNIPEKKYKIQKEAFKYIESYLEIIK